MTVGAQLWMFNAISDETEMDRILSQLREGGFECVETMFGRPPHHRTVLDRIGMKCYATHVALSANFDFADLVGHCRQMGASVVCISGLLQWNKRSADDYKRSAEALTTLGSRCLAEGLSLQYHNHDFEFELVDGTSTGMDLLISGFDPTVVSLCFDAGWASKAGNNAALFMHEHSGIIRTVHLRDFRGSESVALGTGDLDLKSQVKTVRQLPLVQTVLVEQDPGSLNPVGDMILGRKYLVDCGLP